jgi:DNA-binding XRE family transcriptional regulator
MKRHKAWSEIKRETMSKERITRVRREAHAELRAMTLRQLREEAGMTQVELADLAESTQAALSRIERREDNPIATLRRYVEALGGELEVVAVLGNKRVKLLGV